jgi:hypothetical protein
MRILKRRFNRLFLFPGAMRIPGACDLKLKIFEMLISKNPWWDEGGGMVNQHENKSAAWVQWNSSVQLKREKTLSLNRV